MIGVYRGGGWTRRLIVRFTGFIRLYYTDGLCSNMCEEYILIERISSVRFRVSRLEFLAYELVFECIICMSFKQSLSGCDIGGRCTILLMIYSVLKG